MHIIVVRCNPELIRLIIHLSKFEAVITVAIIITVSFIFAVNSENKTEQVNADAESIYLPIVMYHHVTESQSKAGKYTVLKSELTSDLEYLKSNGYSTVTVADLINYVDGKSNLPEKPIMITFDDGFESFYTLVFPLLKQYNMKAVVSVIGSVTEKYSKIDDHNINYSNLDWNEIRELHKSGFVEIQNHSFDMHKSDTAGRKGISKIKNESLKDYKTALTADLNTLQKLFEENCGFTPDAVAYPYGAYSKSTLDIVKSCGFRCTLLCEERTNKITVGNENSLYNLGRYNRESGIKTEDFFVKLK